MGKSLTVGQVFEIVGLGRSSLYTMMEAGTFPRPFQLSNQRVRWQESEISEWYESLPYSMGCMNPYRIPWDEEESNDGFDCLAD